MSDLLFMSRSPLRSLLRTPGLVACYLPYRDVVGRNVGRPSPLLWNYTYNSETKKVVRLLDRTTGAAAFGAAITAGTRSVLRVWVSKAEYDYCRIETRGAYVSSGWAWFVFDLSTGVVTDEQVGTTASIINSKEIVWDSNMSAWRVTVDYTYYYTSAGSPSIYGTPDGTYAYTGDGVSGMYVHQWQHNLGSLYPYSPPVGYSQTLIDYSPQGNHAQLGSTPGGDTNDPAWSPVSLYFDGVDDSIVNEPTADYALYAWGATNSAFGWVSSIPVTAGYWFGGIRMNRTPGASEEARLKANIATLLAGQGVTVA